jgi:hypothetical protein
LRDGRYGGNQPPGTRRELQGDATGADKPTDIVISALVRAVSLPACALSVAHGSSIQAE